ncbi:hypothetical protein JHK86_042327 [Glycine max]|nr:hypothetical protein JHK86_042327 [Glycine max]
MKNQISFLTQFFIILLLCFALGPCMRTCTAHTKAYAPETEPSVGFSPSESPNRENPTSSLSKDESHSSSSSGKDDRSYTSFSTAFSNAFGDILKGTLRGNTITMPEHDLTATDHHSVKDICSHTDYPDVCVSTITPFLGQNFDLMNVLEAAIKACSYQAKFTISVVAKHMKVSPEIAAALGDCKEQYSDALENLHRAMDAIQSQDLGTVTTMLSAVMADVSACESGFEEHKVASPMAHSEGMVSITASICLSIASLIPH